MILLNKIVDEMLREHVGGEKFFDNLDASLQNKSLLDEFWHKYLLKYWRPDIEFIVSGKFGIFLSNTMPHINPIVVRGGLRHNPNLEGELEYLRKRISGIKCVFVDDSFYSGKTRNAIKAEIERMGGELVKTVVVYDGSIDKDESVVSMYRYYEDKNIEKVERACD